MAPETCEVVPAADHSTRLLHGERLEPAEAADTSEEQTTEQSGKQCKKAMRCLQRCRLLRGVPAEPALNRQVADHMPTGAGLPACPLHRVSGLGISSSHLLDTSVMVVQMAQHPRRFVSEILKVYLFEITSPMTTQQPYGLGHRPETPVPRLVLVQHALAKQSSGNRKHSAYAVGASLCNPAKAPCQDTPSPDKTGEFDEVE